MPKRWRAAAIPPTQEEGRCMTTTHIVGICDSCRTAQTFSSVEARDYWVNNHQEHEGADE
jgi:hypothetical protein